VDQAPEPAAPMDQLRQDPDPPEALQCHVAGFGRAKPCVTIGQGSRNEDADINIVSCFQNDIIPSPDPQSLTYKTRVNELITVHVLLLHSV
jgi:hypothetical protein